MKYEQLRDSLGYTNKECAEIISARCPRFTKIQIAMICSPEYGVEISDIAADYLVNADPAALPDTRTDPAKRCRRVVNDEMLYFMVSSKAKGYSLREIAEALCLHENTVRKYIKKSRNHGKQLPPLIYNGKWGYER